MLHGALHLTDYITQVMKRLSDQSVEPKVVLDPASAGNRTTTTGNRTTGNTTTGNRTTVP